MHTAPKCPWIGKLYCGYCDRKGHSERVCKAKDYKGHRSPERTNRGGHDQPTWRARTPERKERQDRNRQDSKGSRTRSASPWRQRDPSAHRQRDSRSPRRGPSPNRRKNSPYRAQANMVSDTHPDEESENDDSESEPAPL